ncbi:MAG: hypothetical protein OCD02_08525 [Spirochaetaceae bacterium]
MLNKTYNDKWQNIVNMMAELIDVPAALIMKIDEDNIKVCISSETVGNPYKVNDKNNLHNSGLYGETVINSNNELLVPDARKSLLWKKNPEIKLNMYSYLGYPIHNPDNTIFGTLCVLDNKENFYSVIFRKILINLREIIEDDLKKIYLNGDLGTKHKNVTEYVEGTNDFRNILRICANCKNVKNKNGDWIEIEEYIESNTDTDITHSLCKKCVNKLYGDLI